MNLLLLNGGPSTGKDTIAKFLYKIYKNKDAPIIFDRLSMPLKTSFSAISNTTHNDFYENDVYEQKKDELIPWLGCSYRQYQINLSEKHFKPLYGQDIFARLFGARLKNYDKDSTVVVPDLGFDIEIDYLEKKDFTLGLNKVLVLRCHREGFDFSKDSRSYVYTDYFPSLDISNSGTAELFENKGKRIFESWLRGDELTSYGEEVQR